MSDFPLYPETGSHHDEPMTAPRAQEPWHQSLPLRHDATDEQIQRRWQYRFEHEASRGGSVVLVALEYAVACAAEARRAPSADTRRLDWVESNKAMVASDISPTCWRVDVGERNWQRTTIRAAIDAAMTREGE